MKSNRRMTLMAVFFLTAILLFGEACQAPSHLPVQARYDAGPASPDAASDDIYTVFLPDLFLAYPWPSPYGIESSYTLADASMLGFAQALNVRWGRMGTQVSWKELQPVKDAPISWDLLSDFEAELLSMQSAGIKPIVTITHSPDWAVVPNYIDPSTGELTTSSCGPIKPEEFPAFADFMRQMVLRYGTQTYGVHDWEFGNEPDVDSSLVSKDSGFGCWGDIDDLWYYGGDDYGNMLKAVVPIIRQADPSARIWLGGLLLATPSTVDPALGKPENFLRGVLSTGAAPYIDVVAYHFHPVFFPERDPVTGLIVETKYDYDMLDWYWKDLGGGILGKASFIRQVMLAYTVDKPLFVNESGFGCAYEDPRVTWCDEEYELDFFHEVQADMLVRMVARTLETKALGYAWYSLNDPGWHYTGLLLPDLTPRPVYNAYQVMSVQLNNARYLSRVTYDPAIEAFSFRRNKQIVHLVYTLQDVASTISVPAGKFIEAVDLYGQPVTPTLNGAFQHIPVGFSPIYVVLNP